jgi:hypothetical protein
MIIDHLIKCQTEICLGRGVPFIDWVFDEVWCKKLEDFSLKGREGL